MTPRGIRTLGAMAEGDGEDDVQFLRTVSLGGGHWGGVLGILGGIGGHWGALGGDGAVLGGTWGAMGGDGVQPGVLGVTMG